MKVYYNPIVELLKDVRVSIIVNLFLTSPELKKDAWLERRNSRPGVQVLSASKKDALKQIKIVYPERARVLCRDYTLHLYKIYALGGLMIIVGVAFMIKGMMSW